MSRPDNPKAGRSESDIFAAPPAEPASVSAPAPGHEKLPAEPLPASFESALSELESVVARMESGELTLEQSLLAYKRGAALLQYCQGKLNDVQQQIRILEAGMLKDFSGSSENGQ